MQGNVGFVKAPANLLAAYNEDMKSYTNSSYLLPVLFLCKAALSGQYNLLYSVFLLSSVLACHGNSVTIILRNFSALPLPDPKTVFKI